MGNDIALDGDVRLEPGLYRMQIFLEQPEGEAGERVEAGTRRSQAGLA